ncbi:MAG: acyl-CoA dehydrogenase family protein [Actinomycetes bacterium]
MMDVAERALLDEAVRGAIAAAQAAGVGVGLGVGLGVGDVDGEDVLLDDVLAGIGWLEMLEAEPRDAIGVVFGALGATNGVATVLDDVVVAGLGLTPRPDLAVVLPRWGHVGTAGVAAGSGPGTAVEATGLATSRIAAAAEVLVVVTGGDGPALATLPGAAVDATRVHGLDPWFGWQRVQVAAPADLTPLDPVVAAAAVAAGQRAIAHQIEGACRTALDQARDHALAREQFGGPVARFQALRHRLAEAFVAAEAIESALLAAWDDGGDLTAALAKAIAARSARVVATQAQQVLAGIGFTTDHPFHRTLKRMMVLEGVLGSADELALDLGRRAIAMRRVPTLVEL